MKINAISFQGVHRCTNLKFTPTQYQISEKIKNSLTSPMYEDQQGYTYAEKLEKQGYDVVMVAHADGSVGVVLATDFKKGKGTKPDTYKAKVHVGKYTNDSEFSTADIRHAIYENNRNGMGFWPVLLIPLFVSLGWLTKCNTNTPKQANKIENNIVKDSIQDSVKTIKADTIKAVRK